MEMKKLAPKTLEAALLSLGTNRAVADIRAHIAALEAEVETLTCQMREERAGNTAKTTRIRALRERVQALEAHVEKLKLDISGHVGVIGQKHDHVTRLQDQLAAIRQRAGDREALGRALWDAIRREQPNRPEFGSWERKPEELREECRRRAEILVQGVLGEDATGATTLDVAETGLHTPAAAPANGEPQAHAVNVDVGPDGGLRFHPPASHEPSTAALDAARLALMDSMLEPVREPDESPAAALERILRERNHHAPPSEALAASADVPVYGVPGANPLPVVPSTAEDFATVRKQIHASRGAIRLMEHNGHESDGSVEQGAKDSLAALARIEAKMGALWRTFVEEMAHWPTCPSGKDFSAAGWARCDCHMGQVRSFLTDAPAVFTLEEVERLANEHCMPGDARRLMRALAALRR